MARGGRRARAATVKTPQIALVALVAFAALAPASAVALCYTNFERNSPQWAQGAAWSCCSDEPVSRIEFKTKVPNQFYDPVDWIVTEYGSQSGYSPTRCDVSLATSTSYACSGSACVNGEPDACYKNYQPPNAPKKLCLRGTCQTTGNNAMCNSNVYIRFDGGEGTDDDEDFAETVTFQTLIPVVFILLAVLFHARRIMLLRRRSGVHVPFFTNTLRERPNVPAPTPAPAPQVISNVQSSQVLIPGQNGRKIQSLCLRPGLNRHQWHHNRARDRRTHRKQIMSRLKKHTIQVCEL